MCGAKVPRTAQGSSTLPMIINEEEEYEVEEV